MAIVELESVKKVYTLGKAEVCRCGCYFSIEKGDFASIVGPSIRKVNHSGT